MAGCGGRDRLLAALREGGVQARWLGEGEALSHPCAVPVGDQGILVLDGPDQLGKAVSALAAFLIEEGGQQTGRSFAMARILRGQYDANDPLCHVQGLQDEVARRVLVFQSKQDMTPLERALEELFPPDGEDVIAVTGAGRVALVRRADAACEEDLIELCRAILETVQAEAGMRAVVGIGDERTQLGELAESYNEALRAIRAGTRFHEGRDVFLYRALVVERFLQEIPQRTLKEYHARLFGPQNEKVLGEEMRETIECFFACNLNLSEAARRLYVHRNTLVYRLDKLQKAVGLDLRRFDDAVIYKLLHMMGSCT